MLTMLADLCAYQHCFRLLFLWLLLLLASTVHSFLLFIRRVLYCVGASVEILLSIFFKTLLNAIVAESWKDA